MSVTIMQPIKAQGARGPQRVTGVYPSSQHEQPGAFPKFFSFFDFWGSSRADLP